MKAIDGTADATGGYAVPQEIDAQIDTTLTAISPIRGIANVVQVGSSGYRKLVTVGGISSGWAAENAVRAETATPSFAEIVPAMGDLFAKPAATQAMLDDAAFDVEAWLATEIATEFARGEGAAFVSGDGVNKPKGFLTVPKTRAGGRRPAVRHAAISGDRRRRRLPRLRARGQADRSRPVAALALPPGRGVRDEQLHARDHPPR